MVKSRKHHNKHHGTMRNKNERLDIHETTFHALIEWYNQKFEKLGWMLLAKKKGYMDKVHAYLNSINRLEKAIEYKMQHIHDKDKADDLEILLENIKVLKHHANKDLR